MQNQKILKKQTQVYADSKIIFSVVKYIVLKKKPQSFSVVLGVLFLVVIYTYFELF
jgi:hypothetical protein